MFKRIFDCFFSIFLLILFSPIFIVLSYIVYLKIGKPVIFSQKRAGFLEKPFNILKFRTMTHELDERGSLLSDHLRLTRLGGFLRKTSLDELPALWNVLLGEMSLVGPRPLLMEYLPRYTLEQSRRHQVQPGITGWAQINGRNALSWEEKFKLDVWYVDNQSFWLDMKILFLTIISVLKRDGINAKDGKSMPKFGEDEEHSF